MNEQIAKELKSRAVDGQITCKDCLNVARELNVSPEGFAKLLTELDIKIHSCQLGCFP